MTVLILCLQIFFFRIIDVSLGVVRTLLSVKRKALLASIVGFFEILIWFLIIRNALNTAFEGIYVALAYASGFAMGTLIGGLIAKQIIRSKINVQVITSKRDETVLKEIRRNGFPATVLEATGSGDEKSKRYLLFIEIQNTDFKKLKNIILELDSRAFIFVNELTSSVNGFFMAKRK